MNLRQLPVIRATSRTACRMALIIVTITLAPRQGAGQSSSAAPLPEQRVSGTRTLLDFPLTSSEVQAAYEESKAYRCEVLPQDEPWEVSTFSSILTRRDEVDRAKRVLDTSTRRHALSVGLWMQRDDADRLPTLSGGQIVQYLADHYVTIQVRVYRDPLSRKLYLGPRPLAATMKLAGSRITQPFNDCVLSSINDIHSLGLYLPGGQKPIPSNLRTLVLLHKSQMNVVIPGLTKPQPKTNLELLVIRATDGPADTLQFEVFSTTDDRKEWHWLKSGSIPETNSDCNIRSAVQITDFTGAGIFPKTAAVKQIRVAARRSASRAAIDAYLTRTGREGGLAEHLHTVLDAIKAGEITPTGSTPGPAADLGEK